MVCKIAQLVRADTFSLISAFAPFTALEQILLQVAQNVLHENPLLEDVRDGGVLSNPQFC